MSDIPDRDFSQIFGQEPSSDNPVSKLPQIILSGILVRDEGLLKDILVNRKTPLPVPGPIYIPVVPFVEGKFKF